MYLKKKKKKYGLKTKKLPVFLPSNNTPAITPLQQQAAMGRVNAYGASLRPTLPAIGAVTLPKPSASSRNTNQLHPLSSRYLVK